jgi:pilus assembly protein Flp/PilA
MNKGARMPKDSVGQCRENTPVFDTVGLFASNSKGIASSGIQFMRNRERVGMLSMYTYLVSLLRKERGASMVEYALLLILIAIIAFVAVSIAGQNVSKAFSTVADGFVNPN